VMFRSATLFVTNLNAKTISPASSKANVPQRAQMATLKDIRSRLRGVGAIRKITSSMKMVAAAKLRVAQKTLEETYRPFTAGITQSVEASIKEVKREGDDKRVLFVPVTSDRGLCGAVNSSIVRHVRAIARTVPNEKVSIAVLDDKGRAGLVREWSRNIQYSFKEIGKKPPIQFIDALVVADHLLGLGYDFMTLYYNRFVSIVQSVAQDKTLGSKESFIEKLDLDKYEMDDLNTEVLTDLYEYYLACSIFAALTEQSTAELGARMSSMDTATKNAGEMINNLNLTYNRRRQATITTELCEIIGGAEALKV